MSDHESQKVEERVKKNPEKFYESEFFDAWVAEMRRKWAEHDLLEYLDEDVCPVCFTNHRIIGLCSFGTRRLISRVSNAPAEVVDGSFEQHFTELQPPASRTHGCAERALDA